MFFFIIYNYRVFTGSRTKPLILPTPRPQGVESDEPPLRALPASPSLRRRAPGTECGGRDREPSRAAAGGPPPSPRAPASPPPAVRAGTGPVASRARGPAATDGSPTPRVALRASARGPATVQRPGRSTEVPGPRASPPSAAGATAFSSCSSAAAAAGPRAGGPVAAAADAGPRRREVGRGRAGGRREREDRRNTSDREEEG